MNTAPQPAYGATQYTVDVESILGNSRHATFAKRAAAVEYAKAAITEFGTVASRVSKETYSAAASVSMERDTFLEPVPGWVLVDYIWSRRRSPVYAELQARTEGAA